MIVVDKHVDIEDLRAETLLDQYFPDIDDWKVHHESFFSRNYSNDVHQCDPAAHRVETTRNGIYQTLPESLFFSEQELRSKTGRDYTGRISEIDEEERSIKNFFMPFDSEYFNLSLQIERLANEGVSQKTVRLLKHFFDFDYENEPNPFIRRFSPMLLHVCSIRGDIAKLTDLLSCLFQCRVTNEQMSPTSVRIIVHKRHLSPEEHHAFIGKMIPFTAFLQEWFLPSEITLIYAIKDFQQTFILSEEKPLILDYNTQI